MHRTSVLAGCLALATCERPAAQPPHVSGAPPDAAQYVGSYPERIITRRGGELYYTDGAGRASRLTPLSATLFEVDEDPATRLRFVAEGPAAAAKLVGLYRDGSADESVRTKSQ